MRAETHAFFFHLAQLAQAEDLETAGVGQQCPIPTHELVQPAQFAHQLVPRTQIEMVGIAQNDLRAQVFQNVLRHGFYGSGSADRHECRRVHIPMSSVNAGLAGRTGMGLDCEGESHMNMVPKGFAPKLR